MSTQMGTHLLLIVIRLLVAVSSLRSRLIASISFLLLATVSVVSRNSIFLVDVLTGKESSTVGFKDCSHLVVVLGQVSNQIGLLLEVRTQQQDFFLESLGPISIALGLLHGLVALRLDSTEFVAQDIGNRRRQENRVGLLLRKLKHKPPHLLVMLSLQPLHLPAPACQLLVELDQFAVMDHDSLLLDDLDVLRELIESLRVLLLITGAKTFEHGVHFLADLLLGLFSQFGHTHRERILQILQKLPRNIRATARHSESLRREI
ncbi:hypothetical protein IWZ00DRAFT_320221 [Phyllosticta capitalensis]